jgi:hypothetical protein
VGNHHHDRINYAAEAGHSLRVAITILSPNLLAATVVRAVFWNVCRWVFVSHRRVSTGHVTALAVALRAIDALLQGLLSQNYQTTVYSASSSPDEKM